MTPEWVTQKILNQRKNKTFAALSPQTGDFVLLHIHLYTELNINLEIVTENLIGTNLELTFTHQVIPNQWAKSWSRFKKFPRKRFLNSKIYFFDPIKALETIEELDKDKDGYLDLDEYLGDAKNIPDEDEKTEISDDFIGLF